MNKISFIIITSLLMSTSLRAQVIISSGSTQAEPTAGLNMAFTDKGFLMPRLSGTQIQAIENPATGLMVFNLSDNKPVFFDGKTWRNQDGTAAWLGCGNPLEILHIAGVAAPVNKTVSYGTVTNIPGELNKCWITQNLGADRQATAVNDATEPSAGWYWQFNKLQGYKHDGTTRTPGTTWITWIGQNSGWTLANDPCNSELGAGWRIPTETEWKNVDVGTGTNWTNWTGPWNSPLKLHAAGRLNGEDGGIALRGSNGRYWSNANWSDTSGWMYCFNSSLCAIDSLYRKQWAGTLRCLKCIDPAPLAPVEGTHVPSQNQIVWNWTSVQGALGYKWNSTNDILSAEDVGTNTSKTETALACIKPYTRYVWAYSDCEQSSVTILIASTLPCIWTTCGDSLMIAHSVSENVAPVDKTTTYGTVSNIPGETNKCWITSNLGASRQATAKNDNTEASAGWYWQFNRKQGYKHTGSVRTPNTWITTINEASDWVPDNDPCYLELGTSWRVPSATEWINVDNAGSWTDWNNPYNSNLKLHAAGLLNTSGGLGSRGTFGRYWSASQSSNTSGQALLFGSSSSNMNGDDKEYGYSVRCLRCEADPPAAPTEAIHETEYHQITWKWRSVPGATGYKWGASGVYSSAIDIGSDTSKVETGLQSGNPYVRYIWAYNSCGNSPMITLTSSTDLYLWENCGDSLTKIHISGSVAPVNKIVTYGTIKNIPGDTAKCWITRNLGANRQAISVSDTSEISAGWYWQFNRKQGYQYKGTVRIPIAWVTTIAESTEWLPGNDPCLQELGDGWHVPTKVEWENVIAGGSWTNGNGTFGSALKLHEAGLLSTTGGLTSRGSLGRYWSRTQGSNLTGQALLFSSSSCGMSSDYKMYGYSIRCVRCESSAPPTPSAGGHEPGLYQITWHWTTVTGATGYKWSAVNNFGSAVEMDGSLSKTETGLQFGTSYTRYAWAYNECGYSEPVSLIASTLPLSCGTDSLSVNHTAGFVAPVSKTVKYGTVSGIPGEPDRCWITSNLGSDRQADSVNESSETSSGWYWQFNRKRGFKHDGTTLVPDTTWITSITQSSNWIQANDPCSIELGPYWRIPTETEWANIDAGGSGGAWTDWSGPWNSALKLHAAGYLTAGAGALSNRGVEGYYWTSTQETESSAGYLKFNTGSCDIDHNVKSRGNTIRCVMCLPFLQPPSESSHSPSQNQIVWNWEAVTGATGYKWNTVNNYSTALDLGTDISKTETSLKAGTVYSRYIWAYNSCSVSNYRIISDTTSPWVWTTCGDSLTISHSIGEVAPVSKTVTYGTVTNIPGETDKCWITANLGANRQATAKNDASEASAGWYWQFNRKMGYKHDGSTRTPNTTWITSIDENTGWLPENDPCSIELGLNWRIPTENEWYNVDLAGSWDNYTESFNSNLKIHAAGCLSYSDGNISSRGTYGFYWSDARYSSMYGRYIYVEFYNSQLSNTTKTYGFSIRCIKCPSEGTVPASPVPGTHIPSSNQVIWNWNEVPGAEGYKWNTVNDYITAVNLGNVLSKTETSLANSTTYTRYLWAYNSCCHSFPLAVTSTTNPWIWTTCGDSLTKVHLADDIAPVSKTVTYGTVSDIPGETDKCWITRNLGATMQALSAIDGTEASAGWYWQFNRKRGYKYDGTSRVPNTTWIPIISENTGWVVENDPCGIELGMGWRIPTETEWFNVDNSGSWSNYGSAYNSILKLHNSGFLNYSNGTLSSRGSKGLFWSNSYVADSSAIALIFDNSICIADSSFDKSYAFPLRCIRCSADSLPPSPTEGDHEQGYNAIKWIWTEVPGATGYKINSGNDYMTAVDLGTAKSFTETNIPNGSHTKYVWAYNSCGHSGPLAMNASTLPFTCGVTYLVVEHVAGDVAPVNKTTIYNTISGVPGESTNCWITKNLGATNQASSQSDASEANAGWYWQFNRKQGYKHDGTTRTPSSGWDSEISENSDWLISNDPCRIELGENFRIPTETEWSNVVASGGWTDWNGPWNSLLKMHAAGYLTTTGALENRGVEGCYWSRTRMEDILEYYYWAYYLYFGSDFLSVPTSHKEYGYPLRCIR
jgi:hypothetical protein